MPRKILLSSVALAALTAPAFADTADPAPETVVVTATRTPEPLDVTGTSMSVITAKDIAAQQVSFVTDILSETPGLTVNREGGPGQTATISLRGAEQGQTVVLIDGIRINDPSDVSEGAVLGDVLANNIDRIEVLRGPQSTLYGSDAIGGVVNIITKRGGDGPFALNALAEGGSFGTWHLNAAADGTEGPVEYGAALNYYDTGGISAADSRSGNTEADGYRNFGASANARVHLGDAVSIDLHGYYTKAHTDFDDNSGPAPLFLVADSGANDSDALLAGYAGLNADFLDGRLHNRIAMIATAGTRQYFDSAFDTIHLNSDDFGNALRFEYQGVFDIAAGSELTFGAETQSSSFRSDSFFSYMPSGTSTGRDRLTGYYAQLQSTLFEQLTLTGGVRLDDDQTFGTHTSFKVAGAWQVPGANTTLRANFGTGFKAPSLYQSFSPYSNPIAPLKPETAEGWEAGADKRFWGGRLRASLTYFSRDTRDQIDFQDCFTPTDAPGCPARLAQFGYYVNIDRTKARGVEAEIAAQLTDTLSLSADYANMAARNAATGLDLARRPDNQASIAANWQFLPGAEIGASAVYIGPRFNDAANLTPLGAHVEVNLFGSYQVTEHWQLFGRIDNLFDDRTETVTGYGTEGLAAFGGVRTLL